MKSNLKINTHDELRNDLTIISEKRISTNKNEISAQDTLPIKCIYDDGIFALEDCKSLKNKKKRKKHINSSFGDPYSISFQFEDMNYQSLSPEDAEVKYNRWKDLMNSLTHDMTASITIINHRQDIEKLKEFIKYPNRNDGFDNLRAEWNDMIENKILSGDSYLSKNRYFTIKTNAESVKKAQILFNRLENEIVASFSKIGVRATRLNTIDRCEPLHDIFRSDHVGEFSNNSFNFSKLNTDDKTLIDYICPDSFEFLPPEDKTGRTMMLGDKYVRCYFINEYPAVLSDRLFTELANQEFSIITTVSIRPESQDEAINIIRKKRLGINSDVMKAQRSAIKSGYSPSLISFDLQQNQENADTLLDEVTNKNQKVFYTSLTLFHIADTYEQLTNDSKTLYSVVSKFLCQLRVAQYMQEECFNQTLPLGFSLLPVFKTCTSEMTCAYIPFLSQELFQKDGLYYGINKASNNLIYIDRFSLLNANGFILGASGSGKSFSAKRELGGMLLNTDADVLVIDPDGEYAPFCQELGGQLIELSPTSNHYINPMDMDRDYGLDEKGNWTDPVVKKADFIISLCAEIIGDDIMGIDPVQRAFIDQCISIVYEPYIKSDYNVDFIPDFKDLQNVFDEQASCPKEDDIAKAFKIFSSGSLKVFSNKTNIVTTNRLTVYDISKLGTTMASMGHLIMLDAVWNKVLDNRKKGITTSLYSDEFTVLLRKEKSKVFFLDVFKRIRKLNGSATGITQNISSLFRDPDATEMLSNSEFVYLLNQAAPDRALLQQLFNLSDVQLAYITDVGQGEGLLKAGRNIVPFKDDFPKDTVLYKAMTTNPKERKLIDLSK